MSRFLPNCLIETNRLLVNNIEYYTSYWHDFKARKRFFEEEPGLITYLKYRLLPFDYILEPEDYLSIVDFASNCSLVDKYLIFIDFFEAVVTKKKMSKFRCLMADYIPQLKSLGDERLETMCFCVDSQNNRFEYNFDEKLLVIKESLISGEIDRCYSLLIKLLEEEPCCTQAINILVEVNCKHQNKEDCFKNTLLKEILDTLEAIYTMKEGLKQNVNALNKIVSCCSMSNWARSLDASVFKAYSSMNVEAYTEAKKQECLQYLDIETVCECLQVSEGIDFISKMKSQNIYVKLRENLLAKNFDEAYKLVGNQDIKCIIRMCDDRIDLKQKKKYFNEIKNNSDVFEILASKYYLVGLDLDTNLSEAVHFAVELLVKNVNREIYIPWKSYLEKIEESEDEDGCEVRGDICVPILYFVQYKYSPSETKDDVTSMCEDFLFLQGKQQPSLLNVHDEIYPKNILVFFLRYVCVPDILSTALAPKIKNSMDLWKERIDICQILCNIDSLNDVRVKILL